MTPGRGVRRRVGGEFVRFSLVGTLGFLIDAGTLYLVMGRLGLGPYAGRVVSYLVAATVTWACHRTFTFPDRGGHPPHRQWALFVAVNAVGAGINYGVYALVLTLGGVGGLTPLLGVACGSLIALAFNFTASRLFVFPQVRRA